MENQENDQMQIVIAPDAETLRKELDIAPQGGFYSRNGRTACRKTRR